MDRWRRRPSPWCRPFRASCSVQYGFRTERWLHGPHPWRAWSWGQQQVRAQRPERPERVAQQGFRQRAGCREHQQRPCRCCGVRQVPGAPPQGQERLQAQARVLRGHWRRQERHDLRCDHQGALRAQLRAQLRARSPQRPCPSLNPAARQAVRWAPGWVRPQPQVRGPPARPQPPGTRQAPPRPWLAALQPRRPRPQGRRPLLPRPPQRREGRCSSCGEAAE